MRQAELRPDAPAYGIRTEQGWKTTSWRDYVGETRQAARALLSLGFDCGDRVCILGPNRPQWVIAAMAAMSVGGVAAGVYTTCSANEVQYIVDHSEAAIVFVDDEAQWRKIEAERARLPRLRHVVVMHGAVAFTSDPIVLPWAEFLSRGQSVADDTIDLRLAELEADEIACLIYTSGTTGPPKAVMLTHRSIAWTAPALAQLVGLTPDDCVVSYLPLSHIAEQMSTIYGPAMSGTCVYFCPQMEQLLECLKEVRPNVFFGVPRVWEKLHAALSERFAQATGAKRALLHWALDVGRRAAPLLNAGKRPGVVLAAQLRLANKLVSGKILAALGLDRARVCVSGAAPIAPAVLDFFASMSLSIQEIYGQSEDCGPTSFNLVGQTRFGTVGKPIPGIDVRIAEDGEILVRGPNVFAGYFKDEAATSETLIDGWLHSGDIGEFDRDGYLRITGRKKDIIITAGGKNITPANIESDLKMLELVAQAVVVGDRRPYLVALLTLDADALRRFAIAHGLEQDETLADRPEVFTELHTGIEALNRTLARVENIRKFRILPREFSIESGELTPTLKIRRNVVQARYAAEIDALYSGGDS